MKELLHRRSHYEKHFEKEDGNFLCQKSLGLIHYFDGNEFRDIIDIPFPEGKEIKSEADLEMIDIPSWAEVELLEDKKEVWFKDKKGVRIHKFGDAFVCHKDEDPFIFYDGNDIREDGGKKLTKPLDFKPENIKEEREKLKISGAGDIVVDKTKITEVKFKVQNGKLSFELPAGIEPKDLKAFDATDTGSTNNKDSYLRKSSPTTNYGSETDIWVHSGSTGNPNDISRGLLDFTLSSGSGTISDVKLFLYNNYVWSAGTIEVHSVSINWNEGQVTWNVYSSGNNWTTAGGDFNATTICSASTSLNNYLSFVLMGTGSTNPLTLNWGDNVNVLLKIGTESTGVTTGGTFYSKNNASNKPYIEITYTASASGPVNLKSYNTNLKANIKSINTNSIANVKSLNTNT